MTSPERRAKRVRARKAARSGEAQGPSTVLTPSQVKGGLINLSQGLQEAFTRIKKLQKDVNDALEYLNARLSALEKLKENQHE